MKLTKSGTYIYGKAKLTWFEEIFEEYKHKKTQTDLSEFFMTLSFLDNAGQSRD